MLRLGVVVAVEDLLVYGCLFWTLLGLYHVIREMVE